VSKRPDPDHGAGSWHERVRARAAADDQPGRLAATELIQPGSRAYYRCTWPAKRRRSRLRSLGEGRLGRGEKIESLDNARPEIRNVTERAQRFLRLAALLAVILAAVAVALAAERYMRRHLDGCAVMRCMGASARQLLLIHGGEFLPSAWLRPWPGAVAGYAVQLALQQMLDGLLATSLPPPSLLPWLHGLAVG
jgi:putative ABC transport system permease protein